MEGNQCCNKVAANFQKKYRNGIENRIFKIIKCFEKKWTKWPKHGTIFSRKLPISRMLFKSKDEKRIFGIMNFQKNLEMEMKKEYLR